jgi:hypothetical protein
LLLGGVFGGALGGGGFAGARSELGALEEYKFAATAPPPLAQPRLSRPGVEEPGGAFAKLASSSAAASVAAVAAATAAFAMAEAEDAGGSSRGGSSGAGEQRFVADLRDPWAKRARTSAADEQGGSREGFVCFGGGGIGSSRSLGSGSFGSGGFGGSRSLGSVSFGSFGSGGRSFGSGGRSGSDGSDGLGRSHTHAVNFSDDTYRTNSEHVRDDSMSEAAALLSIFAASAAAPGAGGRGQLQRPGPAAGLLDVGAAPEARRGGPVGSSGLRPRTLRQGVLQFDLVVSHNTKRLTWYGSPFFICFYLLIVNTSPPSF